MKLGQKLKDAWTDGQIDSAQGSYQSKFACGRRNISQQILLQGRNVPHGTVNLHWKFLDTLAVH